MPKQPNIFLLNWVPVQRRQQPQACTSREQLRLLPRMQRVDPRAGRARCRVGVSSVQKWISLVVVAPHFPLDDLVLRVRPEVRGRLEDAVVDDELPVRRRDGVLGRGQVQFVTVRTRYRGPAQRILRRHGGTSGTGRKFYCIPAPSPKM